jgi:hypothetical protein
VAAFVALAVAAGSAAVSVLVALAPVLLIVAAVAALSAGIFLLVKHWDELSERYPVLQEGLEAVQDAFGRMVRFVQADVVPAMQRVGEAAVAVARLLVEHWGTIWSLIKPVVDNFIAGIQLLAEVVSSTVAIIVAIINGDWSRAWQEAKDILNAFKDFFVESLDNLVELMKAVAPLLWDAAKLAMEALWEGVQWVWTNLVWPGFTAMPGLIVDALGALGSLLLQAGKDILQGMFDGLTYMWTTWVWPFFKSLPGNILSFLGDALGLLYQWGKDLVQGLINGIVSMAGDVAGAIGGLIPGFGGGGGEDALRRQTGSFGGGGGGGGRQVADTATYQVGAESYYGHLRDQTFQPFSGVVNVQVDRQTIATAVIEPWMTEQLTTGALQHGVVN